MGSVKLHYNSKKISVRHSKKIVWLLRIESFIYITIFFSFMIFAIYKGGGSLLTNLIVIAISSVIFLYIVLNKKETFFGKEFSVEFINNGIRINNVEEAETKKIDKVIIKESISTYSANAYYDIYVVFLPLQHYLSLYHY